MFFCTLIDLPCGIGLGFSSLPLLLPAVEEGIFNDNWRIRQSSVELLGDLLFKVRSSCYNNNYQIVVCPLLALLFAMKYHAKFNYS